MTRSLIAKLEDLGACEPSIAWVTANSSCSKQDLWESASPIYMLWLLRRTMTSYRSKKIRTLARCLVDIVDIIDINQEYWPSEVRARSILVAFADGRAETEDVYSLHLSLDYASSRFWEVMAMMSKGHLDWCCENRNPLARKPSALAANYVGDIEAVLAPNDLSWAREIILRHFPNPPRLS